MIHRDCQPLGCLVIPKCVDRCYRMTLPKPTRCPKCGHVDRTTVCKWDMTDKISSALAAIPKESR